MSRSPGLRFGARAVGAGLAVAGVVAIALWALRTNAKSVALLDQANPAPRVSAPSNTEEQRAARSVARSVPAPPANERVIERKRESRPVPPGELVDRAREYLDERLQSGLRSAHAAELFTALRTNVRAAALPPAARVEQMVCGDALCKLQLRADTPEELEGALGAVRRSMPTGLGAAVVYRDGKGGSSLYYAETVASLDVPFHPETAALGADEAPREESLE